MIIFYIFGFDNDSREQISIESQYSGYLKRQRDDIRNTTREINNIKSEMHEIKNLLKQLVDIQ